jgi:amino acid transporter
MKLRREMKGCSAFIVTLSVMSPAAGFFVLGSDIIVQSGSFAPVSLGLAILFGILNGLNYAELGTAFPTAGGDYTILARCLGRWAGFATLASLVLGSPFIIALLGLGAADYIGFLLPNVPKFEFGLLIVVAGAAIAACSIRWSAWVTGLFLATELTAVLGTTSLGFWSDQRNALPLLVHPQVALANGQLFPVSWGAIGGALAAALFALDGYQYVIQFGEEMIDAGARIRSTIPAVLLAGGGLMALSTVAILVGTENLGGLLASPEPVIAFITERAGGLANMVRVAISISLFNGMVAALMVYSRVTYASGRDGVWGSKFSALLAKVHTRFGSPWAATLFLAALSIPACFIPERIDILMSGNSLAVKYLLAAVAVIAGRRSGVTARSLVKVPFYPWVSLFVVPMMLGVILLSILTEDGSIGFIVSIAQFGVGIFLYWFYFHGRADASYRDADTIF